MVRRWVCWGSCCSPGCGCGCGCGGGCSWRCGGRGVRTDLGDRDQGQPDVADLLQQAVQRGLVDDLADEKGAAVALVGHAQSVEPRGPVRVEMAQQTDLVAPRSPLAAGRSVAHG